MIPQDRQRWLCKKQFVEGQDYPLIVHEERSVASHSHFFASVHEAWKNLPEVHAKRFKTSDHLRKWALIRAGYADEVMLTLETPAEALRVAAIFANDPGFEYAVVAVSESVVRIFTAKTQKTSGHNAMDKDNFQKSKQEVLDIVAELIGVSSAELSSQITDQQNEGKGIGGKPPEPPRWVATYLEYLEAPNDGAPKSLLRQHDEAVAKIGGTPSEKDKEFMRRIYGLRQRNLSGTLSPENYDAELKKIGAVV